MNTLIAKDWQVITAINSAGTGLQAVAFGKDTNGDGIYDEVGFGYT